MSALGGRRHQFPIAATDITSLSVLSDDNTGCDTTAAVDDYSIILIMMV